jgi:hypothetical protein
MKRNSIFGWFLAAAICVPILGAEAAPVYPILRDSYAPNACVLEEQRDDKYAQLLRVSVKVSVSGGSGSGTICHFDPDTGWAYVISCGHMWSGNRAYDPTSKVMAKVTVWYHEGSRLKEPSTYDAESLFWSNERGYDVSLLRFRPDWDADYAPIAACFVPSKGMPLNSMGCDGGREVARYEVRFESDSHPDIRTYMNSPRPGRSGGGLLNEDGHLVGVCWGTSDTTSGDGTGFFTPLDSIREVFSKNGHSWLLDLAWDARKIPVVDHDDPSMNHGLHFIPMPARCLE